MATVKDHPRIHGEHLSLTNLASDRKGSPPHTRGTRKNTAHGSLERRITPAYTGNTACRQPSYAHRQDHPRIHGEHLDFDIKEAYEVGSPPHTRGTHKLNEISKQCDRITPAYTGNTKIKQVVW